MPRMFDAEMLVAEPSYVPVAVKLVGIHNAAGLNVPKQNRGYDLAAGVFLSQGRAFFGSHTQPG